MKLLKPTLVAVALIATFGCQKQEPINSNEKVPTDCFADVSPAISVKLETESQKQSYGLGANIGSHMEKSIKELSKSGINLDQDLLMKGFEDAINGKSLLEAKEIQTILIALEQTMKAKQLEASKKDAEKSLTEGKKFLDENAKKEGVKVTASGLQYKVITAATGEKPKATDKVKVHYKGMLTNGETFDSSYDRGQPATFPLNRVIPGWTEGVQLMEVGSKYEFTIPSDLAYGPVGSPPRIPGNSVLKFEVELLEIVKPQPKVEPKVAPKVKVEAVKVEK